MTEYWSDGSDTSDIKILTGELSYQDWSTVNNTLWNPVNIDPSTGQPSIFVVIDGWSNIFSFLFSFSNRSINLIIPLFLFVVVVMIVFSSKSLAYL
jgi:hypothetical protein